MADANPPLTDVIHEGFEPAENSAVKNIVMNEIERLADEAYIDLGEDHGEIEAISWADEIVEVLLAAGVTIPESLAARHDLDPLG